MDDTAAKVTVGESRKGSDEMPFGVDGSGALVHISQVTAKGLACGLSCPGCGGDLVARLDGKVRKRHFAHRARNNCRYASETGLHKYAKEVIERRLLVRLPDVRAANGSLIHRGRDQVLDGVRLEARHHGIIPDIIGTRSGRELLIEIVVTHRCDERKLAVLTEHEFPTIEIDLSGIAETEDLSLLDEAIVRSSDRWWVFHPRIAEAARLEAAAEREAREKVLLETAAAADALRRRIEAWHDAAEPPVEDVAWSEQFLDDVDMCGLRDCIGGRVFGDWLLREPGPRWQAMLLWWVLSYRKSKSETVRPVDLVVVLEEGQMLRHELAGLSPDIWSHAEDQSEGLATPLKLAAAFVVKLSEAGLVDGLGRLDRAKAEQAMQRRAVLLDARRVAARERREAEVLRQAEEARELARQVKLARTNEVRARVHDAVKKLIDEIGDGPFSLFDMQAWWETPLWDGRSPLRRIEHEADGRETLHAEIVALGALSQSGARPARDLLNLPLNGVQKLRRAEAAAQWQSENQRLREMRLERINGFDEDNAWLESPLVELDGLTPRAAAVESNEMYKRVHEIAVERQMRRENRRRADMQSSHVRKASKFAGLLRDAAEHCYPGRAYLWMDTTHTRLGGLPAEVCKSEMDLCRCLDQLEADARMKLPARFRRLG